MKRKLMIALLFAGALSLTACGGEDPGTSHDTGAGDESGATDDTGTDASDGQATDSDATGSDETLVSRTYEIGIDGMT